MTGPANPADVKRRPLAPTHSAPVARSSLQPAFAPAHDSDVEFRLDLRDIPRRRESMDIDDLKPSLLSRLFDLVAPLRP